MNILSGLTKGQVLQRLGSKGATITLNGTGTGDGPIHATLTKGNAALKGWKKRPVGKLVRGKFSVKLTSIPVGGPYLLRLEASGQKVDVTPFFVGDVWILAGQSNMEGVGDMPGHAKSHPLIQAFSMRREWRLADEPLHVLPESPDTCHTGIQVSPKKGEEFRKKATKGSGVGLLFAREMLERSGGVPQGLICTAHGGTSMQQWDPAKKHLKGESMYGSMLLSARATGQPVSGILWYQGESDANDQDIVPYTPRMKKLVAASRRDLGQPRLPWLIVQLGRLFTAPANPHPWNSIQEQQRLLPEKIEFLETVPAIDLTLDDGIHIGADGFPRLATRLASAADRLVYGNKDEIRGPQLRGARPVDPMPACTMEVVFDFVRGELTAGGEPFGFKFTASDGAPLDIIYKTTLRKNTAKLYLNGKPPEGAKLFYGYGHAPVCNITDARGFSLPFFGPLAIDQAKPTARGPNITKWNVSEIIPTTKKLDQVLISEVKELSMKMKAYPEDGFINEHAAWEGKAGQNFFHSCLELSEPMKLEFLMGYDGPFRLWVDGKPFFKNMEGTNPCFPDESQKVASLEAGKHDLHVGMDLNNGHAWGFLLCVARKDVTKEQIRTRKFILPTYSV